MDERGYMRMVEIFEKVKIRWLFLWYVVTTFASVILSIGFNLLSEELAYSLGDIALILIIFLMIRKNGDKLKLDFSIFKKREVRLELIKVVIMDLCISVGALFILTKLIYIVNPPGKDEILSETPLVYSAVFNLILGGLIAPILEEFIFRGVIFSRFSKKFGLIIGILLTSFIFAIAHVKMNMIGAFIFSVITCILFKKYNNILVNIAMHFMENIPLILFSMPFGIEEVSKAPTPSELNIMLVIGLILFVPAIIMFIKYLKTNIKLIKSYEQASVSEVI